MVLGKNGHNKILEMLKYYSRNVLKTRNPYAKKEETIYRLLHLLPIDCVDNMTIDHIFKTVADVPELKFHLRDEDLRIIK